MKKLLLELNACKPAVEWAGKKTWKEIFETCHRGDWLLWLFKRTMPDDEVNLRLLILAKGHCAETVLHLMTDQRSKDAVKAAIDFGNGTIDRTALNDAFAAAYDAYAAAYDAYDAYAAADAADAAADAADAADAAAYAAAAAAAYADAAAADADAADARTKNQQMTADICRKYLPFEVWNIKE